MLTLSQDPNLKTKANSFAHETGMLQIRTLSGLPVGVFLAKDKPPLVKLSRDVVPPEVCSALEENNTGGVVPGASCPDKPARQVTCSLY